MWASRQCPTSGKTDTISLSSSMKRWCTRNIYSSPFFPMERSLELCTFSSCQVVLATGCHPPFSLVSAAFRHPYYASSCSAPNEAQQKLALQAAFYRAGMLDPLSTSILLPEGKIKSWGVLAWYWAVVAWKRGWHGESEIALLSHFNIAVFSSMLPWRSTA